MGRLSPLRLLSSPRATDKTYTQQNEISSSRCLPHQSQTCSQPIRPKKVTDPLTESVRAQICGTPMGETSLANDICNVGQHGPSSTCLAALVNEFMEDETEVINCRGARCNCIIGTCSEEGCRKDEECHEDDNCEGNIGEHSLEILEGMTLCTNKMEVLLLVDVTKAIEAVKEDTQSVCKSEGLNCGASCLRRFVVSYLRYAGYNAAICKSGWDYKRSVPAGNYEYIDVIVDVKDAKSVRLILDVDFKAQFEIARATTQYITYLTVLPNIFLGRAERLQQLLKIMSEAAKCSLRRKGMHLPPWRKLSYMQAKWFSSYKRTTSEDPHNHKTSGEPCIRRKIISSRMKQGETLYDEIVSLEGTEPYARTPNALFRDNILERRVRSHEWQVIPAVKQRHEKKGKMTSGIRGALKLCRLERVHEVEKKQMLLAAI